MKGLWNSFLQTVIQFVRDLYAGLSKAMHRNAVLMAAGISVVTMLTFAAGDLHVGGHNAMVAFAETQEHRSEAETELEEADLTESATDKENVENEFTVNEHKSETETAALTDEVTEETVVETHTTTFADMPEEEKKELPGYEEATEAFVEIKEAEEAIDLSESDYNTLLRIVQAESGGCDIIGKILVANVILNRVDSNEFPDSIHGVVYQKSQFSPVIDGSIDRCKVSDETREAVERALNGEDPSEGALYFMNRSKSAPKNVRWFDTKLSFLFKHGEHEFFK